MVEPAVGEEREMAHELIAHKDDAVLYLTLNRPEVLNALSLSLRKSLAEAFAKADAAPHVRVIVLTGAGHRAFSAGLDLKELSECSDALHAGDDADPVVAMAHCRKPVIGAINGVAITGGFELALACDILIASSTARFADTHMRVGVLPGWGLSQKLSRTIGLGRAKSLSLTGRFIDAQTAENWGLVAAVAAGMTKINIATQLDRAFTGAVRSALQADPRMVDSRRYLGVGRDAIAAEVEPLQRLLAGAPVRPAP
jgi:enoyl-CoA hydratase